MAEVWLEEDEWYPVYTLETNVTWRGDESKHTVSKALLAKHERVMREFNELQTELAKLRRP